jgi:hypothetical protein
MSLKIYEEVTEWKGIEYRKPNHVYLMDGDKVYGYSPWGTEPPRYMKNFLRIDKRGRKFVEVKKDRWGFDLQLNVAQEEPEKPQGQVWTVAGSKGNQYFVNLSAGHWSCTCPGHGYRGKCRHVDEIAKSLA